MDLFNDSTRLAMLKAAGAEEFDTGRPARLWATLEGEYNDPELSGVAIEGEMIWLECREVDREEHGLVKNSRITRVRNGEEYIVKRFEPSKSSGFLVMRLSK